MSSGQIFIVSNEVYTQYGSNAYMIGCSSNVSDKIAELSTAFMKPLEIKFLSKKSFNIEQILTNVFNELKYNRLSPERAFFMLPNIEMVQQMISDFIINYLLTIKKLDNKNDDPFIDDEPILKPIEKKIASSKKSILDTNIADSDIEDVNMFRDLLTKTECIKKVKITKKKEIK